MEPSFAFKTPFVALAWSFLSLRPMLRYRGSESVPGATAGRPYRFERASSRGSPPRREHHVTALSLRVEGTGASLAPSALLLSLAVLCSVR